MKMVVQKNWNNVDTSHQSTSVEDTATTTWTFQVPSKTPAARPASAGNAQAKQQVTRQLAINTLAAMHRRFSLPGPVQPHSRPIAEFRASANKSLDMLRQTIQSAVTREIDQVIKKYLEKFFVPAVNNIRLNLGEESVSEDQVRAVCRAMLDATRLLYSTPPRIAQSPFDGTDETSADTKFGKQLQSALNKRKEADDSDGASKRKKIKQEEGSELTTQSPMPPFRDPEKWNPARLTQETLFIMGSHAHKVLGLGNSRGRLYTRHAGLLRYPADSSDKEWIASHNLVNAVGGKTYIMVLEDIEELATSEAYRHSSLPMLGELTGFKVPMFMLKKIKTYVMKRVLSGEISNPSSPQTNNDLMQQDEVKLENIIKTEPEQDEYDAVSASEMISSINPDNYTDVLPGMPFNKDDSDFADIKMDGIKVDIDDIKVEGIKEEDLDDIKVDGIKVEDLDVDSIKVENIEDLKEEDIKLENDDTLSVCKQTEDEQSNLVDGLLDADIEFLSRNLGNIESDADARKTIEKLTGANPDTLTLVGDEFDLGSTLNTNNFTDNQTTKCITVASTTSGMIHSVPVAHLAPPRITGSTVHYYSAPQGRTVHHLPQATVTIQSIPGTTQQMIRGIPINTKSGTFSTVMSQGTASIIGFNRGLGGAQYLNVTSKSFPTGNILHNAIVSRNLLNRTTLATAGVTYSVTTVRPVIHTTPAKPNDFDTIATTKDMIDNACNSSVMLKKVLTLGSSGATKSFMMHNTQKVLSTGFANGATPPPNVTIVSTGNNGTITINNGNATNATNVVSPTTSTLSATHATLSALLTSNVDVPQLKKN
ncbi:hypothetical protein JYU34_007313 [Plutella xylostella]|uniref:DNTTIP1 dimerisation domain-containing protein n=1 Tax=Plutella xylostella TaxID=51655 RepID=A0ABQ7QQ39_PLUXY|nr:hypothetical protein JYU34_007313 [Plutella xylostella]